MEYQLRYDSLVERFNKAKERLETVSNAIMEKQAQREQTEMFLSNLEGQSGMLTQFDENLWYSLIEYVTVFNSAVDEDATGFLYSYSRKVLIISKIII